MRPGLFIILFIAFTINAYAQHVSITKHKCSHAKTKSLQNTQYIQSDLLNNYDVKYVKLDVSLERGNTDIAGNATLVVQSKINGFDTVALELVQAINVDSIKINNAVISNYTHFGGHIYAPCTPFSMGTLLSVNVFYHGSQPADSLLTAIDSSTSPEVTWTSSESFEARYWWPCKQILSDKIDSVDIWITTDSTNKAGSNGLLKNVTTLGSKKRYEWHTNYPMNYYLLSAAVAHYVEYNIYAHPAVLIGDSILIQNYVYDSASLFTNKLLIDKTATYIEKFSDLFGLYPFWEEKYGHCQTELSGGMEHQTMTTLNAFDNDLVDHELGHQWWGDNITCATWRDIFINEGFASYCEYLGVETTGTPADALAYIQAVQDDVTSAPNGSVYLPITEEYNEARIFDSRLSYDKGSAIIHMMRFEAQNDSLFFAALKNMQIMYKDSVATGEDLKTVLQNTIGISYVDFFNQWYYGEGYPMYSIAWSQANDTLTLNVNQASSASSITPLFKMLMEYKFISTQGDTIVKAYQTANANEFKFKLNGKTINSIVVDPNYNVLKTVTSNLNVTSVSSNENNVSFRIYPNPVTNTLFVSVEGQHANYFTLQFMDASGRVIKQVQMTNFNESIDVSSLAAGTYFVKLNNGTTNSVKRFVKF